MNIDCNNFLDIYLVGGAVRDYLLDEKINDKDWVVVNSSFEELKSLGFIPICKNFPIFLHPITKEEYSFARIEKKVSKGYQGFSFDTNKNVSLKEDLKRRDLTINSLAIKFKNNKYQLIDYYNGLQDLKSRVLRHTSTSFSEDPLRVLRVCRFYVKLKKYKFKIHKETFNLMINICEKNMLFELSIERIFIETNKALNYSYSRFYFLLLYKMNSLNIFNKNFTLEKSEFKKNFKKAYLNLRRYEINNNETFYKIFIFFQTLADKELYKIFLYLKTETRYLKIAKILDLFSQSLMLKILSNEEILFFIKKTSLLKEDKLFNDIILILKYCSVNSFFLQENIKNIKISKIALKNINYKELIKDLDKKNLAKCIKTKELHIIKNSLKKFST